MSFSLFWKRFVRYSQRAESFIWYIGIWCEKTEWKWLFRGQSVIVDPFFFSVLMPVESVYLCLINFKSVEFFRDREFFIRGVFIFRCD